MLCHKKRRLHRWYIDTAKHHPTHIEQVSLSRSIVQQEGAVHREVRAGVDLWQVQ
jgi:hypothetical protein